MGYLGSGSTSVVLSIWIRIHSHGLGYIGSGSLAWATLIRIHSPGLGYNILSGSGSESEIDYLDLNKVQLNDWNHVNAPAWFQGLHPRPIIKLFSFLECKCPDLHLSTPLDAPLGDLETEGKVDI